MVCEQFYQQDFDLYAPSELRLTAASAHSQTFRMSNIAIRIALVALIRLCLSRVTFQDHDRNWGLAC
jgi:hypothetical protein